MENKITVEQFKEWLEQYRDNLGNDVNFVLTEIITRASQIAEPTAPAGLIKELQDLPVSLLTNGFYGIDCSSVDEILSRYPAKDKPTNQDEKGE